MARLEVDDRVEEILSSTEDLSAERMDPQTGEVFSTEESLEAILDLEPDFDSKSLALELAAYAKGERAEVASIKHIADGLAARAAIHTRRAEWLEAHIAEMLEPGTKLEDARSSVKVAESSYVEMVGDPPGRYCRTVPEKVMPDKRMILQHLRAGFEETWAKLGKRRKATIG